MPPKVEYISSLEFSIIQYGYKIKNLHERGFKNNIIAKRLNIPKKVVDEYLKRKEGEGYVL